LPNCINQHVAIQVSEPVRVFLNIDIENRALLSQISETQRKLDTSSAKMKLVEIENIHFTLRFLGDTSLTRIDQIESCLSKIKIEPFEIVVRGVGAFPTKRRPRVIWIGVTQNANRISDLKIEIDSHLEEVGYRVEKTKFIPHATIARVRYIKDAEKLASNLDDLTNQPIGSMTVSKFNMKKSTLTPSGPIYETLWSIS